MPTPHLIHPGASPAPLREIAFRWRFLVTPALKKDLDRSIDQCQARPGSDLSSECQEALGILLHATLPHTYRGDPLLYHSGQPRRRGELTQ